MSVTPEQARAARVKGPRVTNNTHIASGTCWNADQLAEVIEKYDRYGELIKMEITHGFTPGKKQYHWLVLMAPPLNEDDE